jgi:hypothetical protein
MLNCALFGTSWKRICDRRLSIRVMEIDSGRMVPSSSVPPTPALESSEREERETLFGRRTDCYGRKGEGS